MDWAQVLTLAGVNIILFFGFMGTLWAFRRESRQDWIRCQNTIDSIEEEMKDFHQKMHEMEKDFPERLLKIEMESRGMF